MLPIIQKIINKIPIKPLQDVKALGLVIFGLIAIMVTWSGVGVIETNYNLQKQANNLAQQNAVLGLSNNNLSLENQYYNTNQYLELQARAILGKGISGERLILVSKQAALSQITPQPTQMTISKQAVKPSYQQNFESWVAFYFRRSN
ncbi:MAG TPA: hypothetical protein VMR76_01810 [Candidatus Saccharimonadia bacterium]|nr:hypothetical protein [Candidatus Saccharimonadia bacterium]